MIIGHSNLGSTHRGGNGQAGPANFRNADPGQIIPNRVVQVVVITAGQYFDGLWLDGALLYQGEARIGATDITDQ